MPRAGQGAMAVGRVVGRRWRFHRRNRAEALGRRDGARAGSAHVVGNSV